MARQNTVGSGSILNQSQRDYNCIFAFCLFWTVNHGEGQEWTGWTACY